MKGFVKNKKRESSLASSGAGFTLVELPVVLAVISLLAVIVIVSLGDSRSRGKDAAIKSSLLEVAKVSESFAGDTGSYDGICHLNDGTLSDDGSFGLIESSIERQGGVVSCQSSETEFAVISSMNLVDCWCVDWEASSKEVSVTAPDTCADVLTGTTCP